MTKHFSFDQDIYFDLINAKWNKFYDSFKIKSFLNLYQKSHESVSNIIQVLCWAIEMNATASWWTFRKMQ